MTSFYQWFSLANSHIAVATGLLLVLGGAPVHGAQEKTPTETNMIEPYEGDPHFIVPNGIYGEIGRASCRERV